LKKINFPRLIGGFLSFRNKVVIVFAFSISLLITSCEETGLIGLDMVENPAGISMTDTLRIFAYSQPEDSVPTNEISRGVLGMINDPVFGKSRSSIYTEVRLYENNVTFGSASIFDSIVLVLRYFDFYGDTLTRQTINVYELSERIPEDSIIYSNREVAFNPIALASKRVIHKPKDSVAVGDKNLTPHVRLRLSDDFGLKIFEQSGQPPLENNSNFLDFINGFYITVDEHNQMGGMAYLDMHHPYSKLIIYYTNPETDTKLEKDFPINQFCRKFNYFENFGYMGSLPFIQQQMNNEDISMGDSLVFLQGLHGIRTTFSIPGLNDFDNLFGSVTVNKATLYLPVEETMLNDYFKPPSRLLMLAVSSDGSFFPLPDSQLGNVLYGGDYDSVKKQYVFNITRHIQAVVNGSFPTTNFILRSTNPTENAHRVILKGPGRAESKMKIEIIYSVFN